jgi:hypothetical protein
MQLLGGQHREAVSKIEAHLMTKDRTRTGSGSVGFYQSLVPYQLHQFKVLPHLSNTHQAGLPASSKEMACAELQDATLA